MKVALIHDQLAEFGGAERVLTSLKKAYPQADVYVSFVSKKKLGIHWHHFADWRIIESRARWIPFFHQLYSPLRFLLPWIWASWDLSSYDLVIASSSWGIAKGVSISRKSKVESRKSSDATRYTLHAPRYLCYLHTPPRYLYGYDESELKKYLPVRIYAAIVNHWLRSYDYESSQTVDHFIFNSEEIRSRSLKFYRRDGVVIHPPIQSATSYKLQATRQTQPPSRSLQLKACDYYLTVSRLAPTKHIDTLIEGANLAQFPLVVVGTGGQENYLKSIAGPTVQMLGEVSDEQLHQLYAGAKAFLYASVHEDFGMVPVEAMAQGVPVIAYASGGVKETVTDHERGILYHELTARAVIDAVHTYESLTDTQVQSMKSQARAYARSLNEEEFIRKMKSQV